MHVERRQPPSLVDPVIRARDVLRGNADATGRDYERELISAQKRLRLTLDKLRSLRGKTIRIGDETSGTPLSVVELPDSSPIGRKLAVIAELPQQPSRHTDTANEEPKFVRLVELSDSTVRGRRSFIRVSTAGYVGQIQLFDEPNPPVTVIAALAQFSNDLIRHMPEHSDVPTPEAVRAQKAWLDEISRPRYEDTHPENGGAL